MKARLHDLSLARDGGFLLTIATRENVGALFDELHEVDVDVAIKKHREKRSLDANAYSWVLLDKLAEATGTPKSDIYRREVRDVGGNTETVCVREKAVQKLCDCWNKNGIGWQTEVMDSKIEGGMGQMTKSIMQDKRECYISGFSTNLARHHIYGGGRRQLSDIWGCWVWLRADWHNMADYGVHGKDGHELDMRLKRECQKRFEELYGHDTFMAVFKKNYLEEESC